MEAREPFRSAKADRTGSELGNRMAVSLTPAAHGGEGGRVPLSPAASNREPRQSPEAAKAEAEAARAVPNTRLVEMEEQVRRAVRQVKDADPSRRFVDARLLLQQFLEEGDQAGGAAARERRRKKGDKRRPRKNRQISLSKFRGVLKDQLHIELPAAEAQALFLRHGGSLALLPYDDLVQRLYAGHAHNAAIGGARQGAYPRDEPASWGWSGVILKAPPFAKSSVMAPSDWDQHGRSVCRRSAAPPSASLRLEHVCGYSGLANTSPNLFYVRSATADTYSLAYYTAAVGIVYEETSPPDDPTSVGALTQLPDADFEELLVDLDLEPQGERDLRAAVAAAAAAGPAEASGRVAALLEGAGLGGVADAVATVEAHLAGAAAVLSRSRQRFFVRHDDDITCCAVHPELEMIATGQSMASKQRGSGANSSGTVYVWSAKTAGTKAAASPIRLRLPEGDSNLIALAFSADGWLLTTISAEHDTATHHVRVWDWARGVLQCSAVGGKGEPPHIFVSRSNPSCPALAAVAQRQTLTSLRCCAGLHLEPLRVVGAGARRHSRRSQHSARHSGCLQRVILLHLRPEVDPVLRVYDGRGRQIRLDRGVQTLAAHGPLGWRAGGCSDGVLRAEGCRAERHGGGGDRGVGGQHCHAELGGVPTGAS